MTVEEMSLALLHRRDKMLSQELYLEFLEVGSRNLLLGFYNGVALGFLALELRRLF